jgi:predicted MFS family arabinose efflux permease
MTPRIATLAMFFVNGVIVGTWVASIPAIQATLAASATAFGLALLGGGIGGLLAQQVTGQLLMRLSSRRILVLAALLFPLLAPLPLLAPDPLALALVLFVFGYLNATMDLSMNAHGVVIETRGGKAIFSGLHAGWSLGAFSGAIGVAAAVALGVSAVTEAVLAGAIMWLVAFVASRSLGEGSVRTEGARRVHLPSRRALPVALLIVPAAFVAGGLADWGGIYLRQVVGSSAEVAAFAFAAYSLGLLLGRAGGDWVRERTGTVRLLQAGMLLTAVSLLAFLSIGSAIVVLLGMFLAGIGLANVIPQLFGAAGRIAPAGPSMSAVFTFATLAFMIEPAIIGVASDAFGLSVALGLLVLASVVVALAVTRVPAAETRPRLAPELAVEPAS